jgi:hypothetical protein
MWTGHAVALCECTYRLQFTGSMHACLEPNENSCMSHHLAQAPNSVWGQDTLLHLCMSAVQACARHQSICEGPLRMHCERCVMGASAMATVQVKLHFERCVCAASHSHTSKLTPAIQQQLVNNMQLPPATAAAPSVMNAAQCMLSITIACLRAGPHHEILHTNALDSACGIVSFFEASADGRVRHTAVAISLLGAPAALHLNSGAQIDTEHRARYAHPPQ